MKNKKIGCLSYLCIVVIISFILPLFLAYNSNEKEENRKVNFYKSPIKNILKVKIKYLTYSHTTEYGLEIAEGILGNTKIYYPMSETNHKNYNFFIVTFENDNMYLISIPKQLDSKLVFKNNNNFRKLSKKYHLSSI